VASLAARTERGEHVAVWEELHRQPVAAADSAAVAELTMRRKSRRIYSPPLHQPPVTDAALIPRICHLSASDRDCRWLAERRSPMLIVVELSAPSPRLANGLRIMSNRILLVTGNAGIIQVCPDQGALSSCPVGDAI